MKSLHNLLPANKHDLVSVVKLEKIGFPTLNPLLPEMLVWIQDMNWPVATPMCLLLAQAGTELIAEIEHILGGEDVEWSSFIISGLLPKLSYDKQKALIPAVKTFTDRVQDVEYQEIAIEFIEAYNRNL